MKNNYQVYKQQSVMTMTPCDMLIKVYDGLIKELTQAKSAFDSKNNEEINKHLQKSQLILKHLQNTLDNSVEISHNLNTLYDYFLSVVLNANVKKEIGALEDVTQMITELRDTYVQADKKLRAGEAS